jgi:CDP-diacylglycerol--glycerol-3-phosphate 3-phosphatidyltransferase
MGYILSGEGCGMPSIYALKPALQNYLRPLVRLLAAAGVTPNQITVLALILSCITGLLVALYPHEHWPLLLVPLVLFKRMALNAIDGMLAREYGMQTALGGFLNELADVISDAALYLPFALVPGAAASPVVIFVVLAVISEMTGVVAQALGASRRYDGPMGKSDRAFAFGALGLVIGVGIEPGRWFDFIVAALAFLTAITIVNRARNGMHEIAAKR